MGYIAQPSPTVSATIFVAASNASSNSKQRADFVCSGSADQSTIASAVSALPSSGGRIVLSEGLFVTSSPYLIVNSTIIFQGQGAATQFQSTTTNPCFKSSTTVFSDVVFENILFVGPVNNTVSVPTRARTTSGSGIDRAIVIDGSLDTANPGMPLITNITVRNCIFRNTTWSPISLFGITGKTIVTENEFYNCQDPGFIFNQEVTFNDNYVYMSADNGVSISRTDTKITCQGNTFENICRDGIWISGFSGSEGPNYFSVTGNTIRNAGQNGIRGQDAPKWGVICGNEIHKGYFRGASDEQNDLQCNGIMITGYPFASAPSYTDQAQGINIVGNHIYQAPRCGVFVDGSIAIDVKDNQIQDCGTQFFANGSTSVSSNDTTQNIGIRLDNPSTCNNVQIQNNTIIDTRGTPYTNYAIYPYSTTQSGSTAVTGVMLVGNVMIGCRNANNLAPNNANGHFGQGNDGQAILDGTNTVAWATLAGSTYTMTRDCYCTNLFINSGITLVRNGFIVNCTGTYKLIGTDTSNGTSASGATGGAGTNGQNLRGGQAGTNGGTGAGTSTSVLSGGLGGNGGNGGNSGGNNGGTATAVTNPAANVGGTQAPQRLPWASVGLCVGPSGTTQGWAGGGGGASGGGDGTNAGGGGGQGGGVSLTNARYIVLSTTAILKAAGGNGGNGAGGNAAGGGGGGGGLLIINTTSFTNVTGSTLNAANNCTGGSVGTSQGSGTAASAGANGAVFLNIFS